MHPNSPPSPNGHWPPAHQQPYAAQPYAAQPYAPYAAQPSIEFGPRENQIVGKTASWALVVAVLTGLQGISQLLGGNLVAAGAALLVALALYKGHQSLRKVVSTQGYDVHNTVVALNEFGNAFLLRSVIAGLLLAAMALMLLVGLSTGMLTR